jgi:protein TonB
MARHVTAAFLAIVVTFGLFYLMQALILSEGGELGEASGSLVDFVRLKKESDLELKKRKMPEKKEPEEPPPPPDLSMSRSQMPDQEMGEMAFAVDVSVEMGAGPDMGAASSDADIVPIVRVPPQYPLRASERGIEGWVEVQFTISRTGTVKDPFVLNAQPQNIFNRSALRAIRKWKYNPKIEDGEPVERPGVKVRLTFQLQDA